MNPTTDEQRQPLERPKRKRRGNRQLQRYRAKLRKAGFADATIQQLLQGQTDRPPNQDQEQEEEEEEEIQVPLIDQEATHDEQAPVNIHKRKRELRAANERTLSKSLSRLSISQPTTKKPCSSPRRNDKESEVWPTDRFSDTARELSKDVPDFLSVPDAVFKQRLLIEVKDDRATIAAWLETEPMLQYARRCACLASEVCHWKVEQDFWQLYMTTAMAEASWLSQLPKATLASSHLQWPYCKTEKNIQRRHRAIQKKLALAESKLNEYLQQPLPSPTTLDESTKQALNSLAVAILSFVQKGQKRLRDGFKRKAAALAIDINDIRLVKSFWDLQPTQEQILSAQLIWQATDAEHKAREKVVVLKQRLQTNRLPDSYHLLDHSVDNIEKILTEPGFHQDKRTLLAASRQRRIAQYKYDMMALTIETMEALVRSHAQEANREIEVTWLFQKTADPSSSSCQSILDIVQRRQSIMGNRTEQSIKHALSFFEHAPAAVNIEETAGH